jgi:hypothetical protein
MGAALIPHGQNPDGSGQVGHATALGYHFEWGEARCSQTVDPIPASPECANYCNNVRVFYQGYNASRNLGQHSLRIMGQRPQGGAHQAGRIYAS